MHHRIRSASESCGPLSYLARRDSETHYCGCWQAQGGAWAGRICLPNSPLALRRRGRKDFVVRTVPQRFTSATSLYVSMLVNSTSPNVEMPALLTRPHIPGQERTQPVTVWAQIPNASPPPSTVRSSMTPSLLLKAQETCLESPKNEERETPPLADTMSLSWNIQVSCHRCLHPSVLSPS